MHDEATTWIELSAGTDQRKGMELALVLETQNIEHRLVRREHGWALLVPAHTAQHAAQEVAAYRDENVRLRGARPPPKAIGRGWPGVALYAAALLSIAICVRQYVWGFDWLSAGRMDAGRLLDGQWWRAVTALTIHLDADHLLGNLAFGGFFTYFVARYMGGGLGWLAIVASGTLGNVLNGLVQAPDHRSIGASTAVFGALALLTATTWKRGFWEGTPLRTRIAPLVAGLGLLAYTGTGGENTDIGAHLMGFVAGFVLGLIIARGPVPRTRTKQIAAGCLAGGLVGAAWAWGIIAAG